MYDNEYFVVDMSSCSSTSEIINSLSLALETLNHSDKKIVLKLNHVCLSQSQMLSIQSLVTSYGCTLDTIETINSETASIAKNMNITVQKPIEKRIEIQNDNNLNDSRFEHFNIDVKDQNEDTIVLKDINGLHFEADLDAIKNKQNEINISSDLKKFGINIKEDFKKIEQQIISQCTKPDKYTENIENNENTEVQTNYIEDDLFENEVIENHINAEKNSIGVYKKAYDKNEIDSDDWEEVDFYETPTTDPVISDSKNTTYINQTLRSGQILESDGNVVIIGDCHPGSEIRAIGDITVWGILSGIAHAGYKGNKNAKVRALKMNAVQLRIANCYSRRPDGTNIPYIIKSSIFTPEEARVVDNEIMLFKINQN